MAGDQHPLEPRRRGNELLAPLRLTFPRYEALILLHYSSRGETPLGKISGRLQVHRASVTNVIDKLVDSGYVERMGHTVDRRAVLACITTAGREVALDRTKVLNAARFGLHPFGDNDSRRLFDLLEPLRRNAGDFAP